MLFVKSRHSIHNPLQLILLALLLVVSQLSHANPKIEEWETSAGLKVYFVQAPEIPMLDLRLSFSAGSAYDGDELGISGMTISMLNKGAAGLNADQIAEKFESVGANFYAGSGRDSASISLRTLTLEEQMNTALDSWLNVIEKPEFPETDFSRLKKQALLGLEAEKQHPSAIAGKAFYKNLYPDHPYGQPQNGNEETINALSTADLKVFYKRYFVNKNGQLAMVGAIDKQQAMSIAERVSKALMGGERGLGVKASAIPQVKPLEEAKTIRIPYPSSQAHIFIGQPGNKRGDKDYFSLYLANHELGGSGFTSRLMKEIRVKRGLSYSVYSYFVPMKEFGPFMIGLQTQLSQTDEAIKVTNDVLKNFQEEGPSEENLKASKMNIIGGFPLGTASNSDILGYIEMIGLYGLPLNYLETFPQSIEAESREQVTEAFKRRINLDKMLTIIVGGEADKPNIAEAHESEKKEVSK